jgi:hypothetical protein
MTVGNRTDSHLETPDDAPQTLKRRGLIAGAAALVTGLIAQQGAQSVAANTNDPLTAGNAFSETSRFILKNTVGPISAPPQTTTGGDAAVFMATDGSVGVIGYGYGGGSGVYGASDNGAGAVKGICNPMSVTGLSGGYGVFGQVNNANGTGVYGKANVASGIGLFGEANGSGGTGVHGDALGGTGVYGFSGSTGVPSTATPNAGVFGTGSRTGAFGFSGGANGVGVLGQCDVASGTGVNGVSASGSPIIGSVEGSGSATNGNAGVLGKGTKGPGVQGQSTAGHGLIGYTSATDGHAALIGYAQVAGGIGLIGRAPGSAGPWAGVFYGDVAVIGALQVYGAPKNAVTKHPQDGTYRALYCEESTESWFADYGRGKLTNGKADITLDPDFAAFVHTDDYHVFPVSHDAASKGLAVTAHRPDGFTVQEHGGGTSGGTFSYRIVARRKDIKGERLATIAPPPPLPPPTVFTAPDTSSAVPKKP